MECQQVPDEDVIPVLLHLPHHKDQRVKLAHVSVLYIDNVDLKSQVCHEVKGRWSERAVLSIANVNLTHKAAPKDTRASVTETAL